MSTRIVGPTPNPLGADNYHYGKYSPETTTLDDEEFSSSGDSDADALPVIPAETIKRIFERQAEADPPTLHSPPPPHKLMRTRSILHNGPDATNADETSHQSERRVQFIQSSTPVVRRARNVHPVEPAKPAEPTREAAQKVPEVEKALEQEMDHSMDQSVNHSTEQHIQQPIPQPIPQIPPMPQVRQVSQQMPPMPPTSQFVPQGFPQFQPPPPVAPMAPQLPQKDGSFNASAFRQSPVYDYSMNYGTEPVAYEDPEKNAHIRHLYAELEKRDAQIDKLQHDNEQLRRQSSQHELDMARLQAELEQWKKKYAELLGDPAEKLGRADFGQNYDTLGLEVLDHVTWTKATNDLKNVLNRLDVSYPQLRDHVTFLCEQQRQFVSDIHAVLHGRPLSGRLDRRVMAGTMKLMVREVAELVKRNQGN